MAQRILNPYYFAERALQVGFKKTLGKIHINQANSISPNTPNYSEIEIKCVDKILRKKVAIHATLKNQFEKKIISTVLSA